MAATKKQRKPAAKAPAKRKPRAPAAAKPPAPEPDSPPSQGGDIEALMELERVARRARFERWKAWSTGEGAIDELCSYVASGGGAGSLNAFAKELDFPYQTVRGWIEGDPERLKAYRLACDFRADCMADELIAIADTPPERDTFGKVDPGSVRDKQLRIETRKWVAAKLLPRRYGDKVAIGGADDLPPVQQQVDATLSPSDAYKRLIGA